MNRLPYLYTPRPGEWVSVRRDEIGACSIGVHEKEYGLPTWVRIPVVDVPAQAALIATAMHEAAGLPAPVILKRPKTLYPELYCAPGLAVIRDGRGTVISIGEEARALVPDQARGLAAYLAISAEADEADATEAEVHALALVLSDGTSPTDEDRTNARTVLRAGYGRHKQQQGERA